MTLSLEEALQQARANSPAYRQTLNDAGPAKWGVRNAYGSLLPSVTWPRRSGLYRHRASPTSAAASSGPPRRSSPRATVSASSGSSDGRVLTAPGQQKALRRATDEDISGAGVDARGGDLDPVSQRPCRPARRSAVARQQVRAERGVPEARQGALPGGPGHPARRASGGGHQGARRDVALLRAVQAENEAKLDLLRRMGVEPPVPIEQIVLTDSFPVTAPAFQLDQLLALADEQNPALRSLRARRARRPALGVRAAKSRVPADALAAGRVERVHPAVHQRESAARARRSPTRRRRQPTASTTTRSVSGCRSVASPPTASAAAGLDERRRPLLDRGGPADPQRATTSSRSTTPASRSRPACGSRCRSSPASAARSGCPRRGRSEDDADESVRARRLQVRSDVHARYLGLQTAYQAIARPGGQPRGGAGPAPAGAGPLPARRGHVAGGVGRAERGAAGRRRLRQRGLRLPQGHRRAGSRGRPPPSLTRNAHVARDEDRSDRRGPSAGRGWGRLPTGSTRRSTPAPRCGWRRWRGATWSAR